MLPVGYAPWCSTDVGHVDGDDDNNGNTINNISDNFLKIIIMKISYI